jgi:hypothetical protein
MFFDSCQAFFESFFYKKAVFLAVYRVLFGNSVSKAPYQRYGVSQYLLYIEHFCQTLACQAKMPLAASGISARTSLIFTLRAGFI